MSDHATNFNRQLPEMWCQLSEDAMFALEDGNLVGADGYSNQGLWLLAEDARGLDMKAVEENLYYAMGQGMCELAKILRDPDAREEIIDAGAELLLRESEDSYEGGISALGRGERSVLSEPFAPQVNEAYRRMAPEAQVAGNFMSVVRSYRLQTAELDAMGLGDDALREAANQVHAFTRAESPHLPALLTEPVTKATAIILDKIIKQKTERGGRSSYPTETTRQFLRNPSVLRVVRRSCALRIDDIFGQHEYVDARGDGVEFIEPPTGTVSPNDNYGSRSRQHYERDGILVCPAANVNGMVPLALEMTVAMIDRACQRLETESALQK